MDYKEVEALLDKYWACETSLEEEERLKDFFSGGDVPENLLPYVPMFQYYHEMRSRKTSDAFEKNILDRIEKNNIVGGKQRYVYRLSKIAAAVLLVLSFIFIHDRYMKVKEDAISFAKDTFEDPNDALDEARRVLLMVSSRMNQGTATLVKVNEFNKVEEIFEKSKTQ